MSVFGDGINIEDTMGAVVRYESGAIMSYSLTAYSPREGFRVAFTGTKGRLEIEVSENNYINGAGDKKKEGGVTGRSIVVYPMFGEPYEVPLESGEGGHGGGDAIRFKEVLDYLLFDKKTNSLTLLEESVLINADHFC